MNDTKFEQAIRDDRSRLERYCRNHFRVSGDDAGDLVQEALIRAWKSREKFDGRTRIENWLTRILINIFLDSKRNKVKGLGRMDASLDAPASDNSTFLETMRDPRSGGIPEVEGSMLGREISALTCELSPTVRSAFCLYAEGLRDPEIALVIGVSEKTVKSRVHRARLKMQPLVRELLSA